jgi:hypothetical protein
MLKSKKSKIIAGLLVALVLIIGIGGSINTRKTKFTLEQFESISTGMTYQDCKEIFGEGELLSESEIAGASAKVYMWQNKLGSNLNITFQDGKVVSKAQAGLK